MKKGLPFRTAYKISGTLVAKCIEEKTVLEALPLEAYRGFSPLFDEDIYAAINLRTCVEKRISLGGPTAASVEAQIAYVRKTVEEETA